ncbi:MAG: LLM class F420-dependent oxidoreductase [Chloroflexota bacterium]|nr:LLM class F420-dependent oxidoreductase [Chloroflexota bacterium]
MAQIGYTLMCEQRSPKDLVRDAVMAEQAGFDFCVISDHFHPWVEAQGHSGYAWSILGAVAQATERLPLMTYVTSPIIRYHPAIVAQKAATMALLSDGRFRLGLGAGERLNEHVVGQGYPAVDVRHAMLAEAVEIIRQLWQGGYVTYRGEHFDVEGAKLFDLPPVPPPLGIAVSGKRSCDLAGRLADLVIATEPKPELVDQFNQAGGAGKPAVGQTVVCWGPDEAASVELAHEQFGWSLGGWKIQAELPNTVNFEAFVQAVAPEQVAQKVPCGPDPEKIVQSVKQFVDAGFDEVAIVQGGQNQAEFCDFFARELAPTLRAL